MRVRTRAMLLVLAGSILASGCAIADRISGVSETRQLQATGIEASATILEISDTGITVNQDPVVRLLVEVHPAASPAYHATIPKSRVSRVHLPQFQPGAQVRVRVDPQNLARVALDMYRY